MLQLNWQVKIEQLKQNFDLFHKKYGKEEKSHFKMYLNPNIQTCEKNLAGPIHIS